MLEILALLLLRRHIGRIVEDKGLESEGYKFLTVVLWFGGEILGGVAMSRVSGSGVTVYVAALIGAIIGACIAYFIAENASSINSPSQGEKEKKG